MFLINFPPFNVVKAHFYKLNFIQLPLVYVKKYMCLCKEIYISILYLKQVNIFRSVSCRVQKKDSYVAQLLHCSLICSVCNISLNGISINGLKYQTRQRYVEKLSLLSLTRLNIQYLIPLPKSFISCFTYFKYPHVQTSVNSFPTVNPYQAQILLYPSAMLDYIS